MSPQTGHFYEFESFRLDPSAKVLFREGKRVSLTPKAFDPLQILVEHAGRLLEKEDLMQKIWQGRCVEESNLTFNIKMLRRALHDDAHEPRFIENIPRRGYRFIAKVKEVSEPAVSRVTESDVRPELSPSKSRKLYLSIAAVLALAVGSLVIALSISRSRIVSSATSAPILATPFKSENFSTAGSTQAVITPDGKYVAYTNDTAGKQSIWLRKLETSENIQVVPPSEEAYLGLAISHDGNSLYFVRKNPSDDPSSAIYRVMTFCGIPTRIAERLEGWVSVSPDDKQISFVRCNYRDDDFCSLLVVDSDGKNERRLLTRPRPIRISDNQFSPDGKSIAFAAGQSWTGGSDFRLMRVDLASHVENEISAKTFFNIRNLKWLPNGDSLLVVAKEHLDGRLRIWQVLTGTGEPRVLRRDATDYVSMSLDRAADKMIATHASSTFRLYLAPATDLNNPKDLTAASSFTLAPEGRIIYSGTDGNIWTINRNGGEQRQLTNNAVNNIYPQTSRDGRYVFFSSNRSGSSQVWRMNSDGSNQIQLTKVEGGYPRFVTPDGKWIYFESGLHQTLWRVATDGGEESQVLNEPISSPAFSPNGNLVAYFVRVKGSENRYQIAEASLETRQILKTLSLPEERAVPIKIVWANGNRLYYVTASGPKNSLWRQSLDRSPAHLVGDMGNEEIADLAVSADGSTFAFVRGKWIHNAVLIEGLK